MLIDKRKMGCKELWDPRGHAVIVIAMAPFTARLIITKSFAQQMLAMLTATRCICQDG